MFTETELRDALRNSASRADALPGPSTGPDEIPPIHVVTASAPQRKAHHRWKRIALPAAAAAAVAGVTIASVLVARTDDSGRKAASPLSPSHSVSISRTRVGPQVDTSGVVDLVQVHTRGVVVHDIYSASDPQIGVETLRKPLGDINAISLTVIPGSSQHFDSSRIPRDHPVQIAGTTGYYSKLKLFPIDGNHRRFSDKWLKHWTIAFRTPHGDWAFAYFDNATPADNPNTTDVSIDDPAKIVRAYDKLNVSFVANRSTLAYRFGYLPHGVQFGSASFETGGAGLGNPTVSLADGAKRLDVQLSRMPMSVNGRCVDVHKGSCPEVLDRKIGKNTLELHATGYSRAEAKRVLESMIIARDLEDPATYFTIEEALS